jgi:hypothetical protein
MNFVLLVGGQKKGERQDILTPGALPRNTRRAVAVDEFKKMSKEVKNALTQVRSEGIVIYTKVLTHVWEARTRILFFSSPMGRNNKLASYNPPIKAVAAMFDSSNEDIRRTDHFYLMHGDDVPVEKINRRIPKEEKVEHYFKSENFKCLLTYAWTANANNIEITKDAVDLIFKETIRLSKKYIDKITIIDGKSHRYKLCIGAMNHAIRCFSTNKEEIKKEVNGKVRTFAKSRLLMVLPEHVKSYVQMFEEHMDSDKVGYLEYSQKEQSKELHVDRYLDLDSLFKNILPQIELSYARFKEVIFSRDDKAIETLKLKLCPNDPQRGANELIVWLCHHGFMKISNALNGKFVTFNEKTLKKLRRKCDDYFRNHFTEINKREIDYKNKKYYTDTEIEGEKYLKEDVEDQKNNKEWEDIREEDQIKLA